ncbi:MAG: NADH-quinone oxidoreductase subunit L [Opitutaceae bacterium]|nr:NADH-quinone oxidoreductase subunit L [Opitutaceae bacterium]
MQPEVIAFSLLLTPLTAAVLIAFFFRRSGKVATVLSVGAAALIGILSYILVSQSGPVQKTYEWLTLGSFSVSIGFLITPTAGVMLLVVAFVGFFIHVFSIGYMKGDPHVARFFGAMSLFMFSMIGLTMADDLITLFIFWEMVGLCSYLLISFYHNRPSAIAAGNKAFIVNRIGDFGFIIGIVWAYWTFGTTNLSEMQAVIAAEPSLAITPIALLLFCGTVGKSGQVPLHVWLPDAMEGPTPVSALIHAATMVAAGIYLLCRISAVMTFDALTVIMWVGTITALYAGFCAITQRDIKKILAYSTVSQLGYMVAAYGLGSLIAIENGSGPLVGAMTGGVAAAMFHLTTHAFFKALLFLGSGSIIHACHHEQNIFNMGGLAGKMPLTFLTFTIGCLALIGFPFLAGFFSKDAILYLALEHNKIVFGLLVFGALLTALYMTRLWCVVFWGKPKTGKAEGADESGPVMVVPLIVLSVFSIIAGYTSLYPAVFYDLVHAIPHPERADHWLIVILSVLAVIVGFSFSLAFYKPGAHQDNLQRKLPAVYGFLAKKLWFDEFYNWYVAKVQQRLAQLLSFFEQLIISGFMVRGVAGLASLLGWSGRSLHIGSIHGYVYWFFAGILALWLITFGF